MMTCDYKDLKCVHCGGTIPKGDTYTGSFVRPRHPRWKGCEPAQAQVAVAEPAAATPAAKAPAKVFRVITEDDASVYGSQYLGREGEKAWMPGA